MNQMLNKEKISSDNEDSLRPSLLKDYKGQEKVRDNVAISVKSAKLRNKSLDHMLFYGPPGLGKTTIANIIANEMGTQMKGVSGPGIDKPNDLVGVLLSLQPGDVLFIDEIHRLPRVVEEVLYTAMEDFYVDIMVGEGTDTSPVRLELNNFTLVGATTKAGSVSAPLRDRFGSVYRLELYSIDTLVDIIKRAAKIMEIKITNDGAVEIAKRSRGTPRIAIRLLKRLLDFAVVANLKTIDKRLANKAFSALEIDECGLDSNDIRILKAIHFNFNNGPVGVETLSSFTGEDTVTIEDVCEPFLMQQGLISKTPRGRVITEKGINYITGT